MLVSSTIGIASAILTEAGLSFLGFGVPPPDATSDESGWKLQMAKKVFRRMPDRLLTAAGKVLYRHMG